MFGLKSKTALDRDALSLMTPIRSLSLIVLPIRLDDENQERGKLGH